MNELMQSRGVRRPSVNFYTQVATSTTNMTRSPPNLHTIVPIRARIQDVLKVNVKLNGHVIRTLLWCHEMFAIQHLLTFCLYMRSLYEAPLHSPSSISVRQLHVLSTSWNELLRHWRSGLWHLITTSRRMQAAYARMPSAYDRMQQGRRYRSHKTRGSRPLGRGASRVERHRREDRGA